MMRYNGHGHVIRSRSCPHLACLLSTLALSLICSANLSAQTTNVREATVPTAVTASPAPATEIASSTLASRLSATGLNPEQRAKIIADLEARREALMDEYLVAYRKIIRDNHRLHPEDPWLASEKIGQALQSKTQMIEQHNQIADFLDKHAPVIRPDTGPQLRAHLAKLPAANREFFEATKAALLGDDTSKSFEAIAAAHARLKNKLAEDMATAPVENSRPLRDSPERQAYLRRLHQSLLETNPDSTPPLAEFLNSQRLDQITHPTKSKQ